MCPFIFIPDCMDGSYGLIPCSSFHSDRQSMGIWYIEVHQGKRQEYYAAIANVSGMNGSDGFAMFEHATANVSLKSVSFCHSATLECPTARTECDLAWS